MLSDKTQIFALPYTNPSLFRQRAWVATPPCPSSPLLCLPTSATHGVVRVRSREGLRESDHLAAEQEGETAKVSESGGGIGHHGGHHVRGRLSGTDHEEAHRSAQIARLAVRLGEVVILMFRTIRVCIMWTMCSVGRSVELTHD